MKSNVFKKTSFSKFFFSTVIKSVFLSLIITIVFGFAFGYKYINIISSSMAPYMPIDTIIIVKYMDIETIKPGDVVTYKKTGANVNVTHRVVGFDKTTGGLLTAPEYFWRSYGDVGEKDRPYPTGVDGASPIKQNEIVGVVVAHFVGLGNVFEFIQDNIIMLTIGLVLILFVISFI